MSWTVGVGLDVGAVTDASFEHEDAATTRMAAPSTHGINALLPASRSFDLVAHPPTRDTRCVGSAVTLPLTEPGLVTRITEGG